jgi:uncharacterized protein
MKLPADLKVRVARSFVDRTKGYLGCKRICQSDGLLFPRCSSVHTFGMRTALDIIFLAKSGHILQLCEAVPAWQFRFLNGAWAVLELAPLTARLRGFSSDFQFDFDFDCNGNFRGVL